MKTRTTLNFLLAILLVSLSARASAFEIYGLIGQKWAALGGSNSPLGNPTSDEKDDGFGGRISSFENGFITWKPGDTQAYAIYGAIGRAWWNKYGSVSIRAMGRPVTDEDNAFGEGGRMNMLERGAIFWNPQICREADNVCAVYGDIYKRWLPNSIVSAQLLGQPVFDEKACKGTSSRTQQFNYGIVLWRGSVANSCIYNFSKSDSDPCARLIKADHCMGY